MVVLSPCPTTARTVELHEDQVPDFDVAGIVVAEGHVDAGGLGGFDAHVVENFGTRAAGAGFAHLPEIVLEPVLEDAILRNAGFDPELLGFVVARNAVCAFEDRDVEAVFGNAEPLRAGDQLPGELRWRRA